MIRSRFVRSFAILLTVVAAISCTDGSSTGPSAPAQSQNGLLAGVIGGVLQPVTKIVAFVADATGLTISPVAWADGHDRVAYSVSGTITSRGGILVMPESDFSITFPPGAVSQPTLITITSDPNYVAYRMEPHGISFAYPVVVTQLLRNTAVYGRPLTSQLFGAYIADDLIDIGSVLNALEIETSITIFAPGPLPTHLPVAQIWYINHFSRYMLASG